MNKETVNILRVIALAELILGMSLFSKELSDYMHLPTIQFVDEQFGDLVDWFKYKESCYGYLFLYSLVSLTGLSFWINLKVYGGMTYVLVITLFFVVIRYLCLMYSFPFWLTFLGGISSWAMFMYLAMKMLNSSFMPTTMRLSKIFQWVFFVLGGISCYIWLLLGLE